MFICKANTRGYGFQEGDLSHEIVYAPERQKVPTINGYQIIKATLQISFDGESWYLLDAVESLVKMAQNTPASKAYELLGAKQ